MNRLAEAVRAGRMPSDVDIIDIHAHVGPFPAFFIPDPDPDTMLRVMNRTGVATACISSHRAIGADAESGNVETATVVHRFAGRFLGYLTVNPHQRPLRVLDRFGDDPAFVGVKLHPDLHRYPVSGDRYQPAFEFAAARGWPILVHSFDGSPYDDPEHVALVAERHPEAQIIVGHAGATPSGFDKAVALARTHDNLHLEISGSWMTGTHLRQMVKAIGPERILFGSDQPFIDLRYSLGRVAFAALSEDASAAILGANARRLLGPRAAVAVAEHVANEPASDAHETREQHENCATARPERTPTVPWHGGWVARSGRTPPG